jgi:hypothetical protein
MTCSESVYHFGEILLVAESATRQVTVENGAPLAGALAELTGGG